MRRLALSLAVSLAILASGAPTPAGAFPMRFGGGARGHVFVGGHTFPGFFKPFPFIRRPFFRQRFFNRFAVAVPFPIGFSGAWSPFYGYPSPCYGYPGAYGAYDGGTYDPPPAAFTIPATYAAPRPQPVASVPPVPPPPMPEVVEYSTGRYQLRDDGTGNAYRWVWIPNPPAGPPAESGPPDTSPPARPGPSRLFRWKDDEGVLHVTNLWEDVPPQYRQQAKHPQTS
jgi:hypothetical protein